MTKAVYAAWRTSYQHRSFGDHEAADLYAAVARDRARALARRRERERGWSVLGDTSPVPRSLPPANAAARLMEVSRRHDSPVCRN